MSDLKNIYWNKLPRKTDFEEFRGITFAILAKNRENAKVSFIKVNA